MVHWNLDIARVLGEVTMLAVVWLRVWVVVEERRLSHHLGMGV
jgi:hypothetical protein